MVLLFDPYFWLGIAIGAGLMYRWIKVYNGLI